jgi:hypothetical protein
VLPHSDLLVVFTKQLLADCVTVLGDDADQPVNVLGMVSNELRELLHLGFEMFQAPPEGILVLGRRLSLCKHGCFLCE